MGDFMNGIAWAIIICEVLFWILIISGLTARYIWRKETVGFILLAMTPVVDLVLLLLTGFDMYRGATATLAHGIAAIYIGVSIAYGKSMIKWADEKFRYYILKSGQKPIKLSGQAFAKKNMLNWVRHLVAFIIGAGFLIGLIVWVDDSNRTEALQQILRTWTLVLGIDLVITISYFIWPKPSKLDTKTD